MNTATLRVAWSCVIAPTVVDSNFELVPWRLREAHTGAAFAHLLILTFAHSGARAPAAQPSPLVPARSAGLVSCNFARSAGALRRKAIVHRPWSIVCAEQREALPAPPRTDSNFELASWNLARSACIIGRALLVQVWQRLIHPPCLSILAPGDPDQPRRPDETGGACRPAQKTSGSEFGWDQAGERESHTPEGTHPSAAGQMHEPPAHLR